MNVKTQKIIAARVLKTSPKKVKLNQTQLSTIKDALTRNDIRGLISSKSIVQVRPNQQSRSRARKLAVQKSKGLRKGPGSRKGTAKARLNPKNVWMNKVRLQRDFVKQLRDSGVISVESYRDLYLKVKGNFFRNKRHIKLYAEEQQLFQKKSK